MTRQANQRAAWERGRGGWHGDWEGRVRVNDDSSSRESSDLISVQDD